MFSARDARLARSWAVLPCACIFENRTKVPLIDIPKQWDKGQILICERQMGYGQKPTLVFIASCGPMGYAVGHKSDTFHTQTLKSCGYMTIKNIIDYRTVDGKVVTKYANGDHLDAKAPVYCFK